MNSPLKIVKGTETAVNSELNKRVLSTDELAILNKMNGKFGHVIVGGKHRIVSKIDCTINGSKLSFESLSDFHNHFTHLPQIAGMNRGKAWASWGEKAFFDNGIGFYPNTGKRPAGCYNLFEGWHCAIKQGDCSFIINHIIEILCDGNEEAGNYFIQWLAHMFQYPEIKPSVAIFMKSVEGTGKGSLFRLLHKMLGVHTSQINGAELVTRGFNGILTAKLLIFADEVNLTDRDVFDKMKGLISEPTCQLEKKGIEAEPMVNLTRFIFASNHEEVIPAGKRERRFLLIEASPKKAGDKGYWITFNKLINSEYAANLLHYLLNLDLSGFDPYNGPITKELIEQKILNLNVLDTYLYEELSKDLPFDEEKRAPTTKLMNNFVDWVKYSEFTDSKGKKLKERSLRSSLSIQLKKLGFIKIGERADRNGGVHFEIPDIQKLREAFASEHGLTAQDLFS